MKVTVPDAVRHAIKDVDLARFAETRRKIQAREQERLRLEKIVRLRQDNAKELLAHASAVFEWRDAFARTEEAGRIWELLGPDVRLIVFGARFWRGEPTDDRHCWATLSLAGWHPRRQGAPPFWYEERYNTPHGSSAPEDMAGPAEDPQRLVDRVHPDFLTKAVHHLSGPDAWTYVVEQLKRLAK